jgi:hypothetical protein
MASSCVNLLALPADAKYKQNRVSDLNDKDSEDKSDDLANQNEGKWI